MKAQRLTPMQKRVVAYLKEAGPGMPAVIGATTRSPHFAGCDYVGVWRATVALEKRGIVQKVGKPILGLWKLVLPQQP